MSFTITENPPNMCSVYSVQTLAEWAVILSFSQKYVETLKKTYITDIYIELNHTIYIIHFFISTKRFEEKKFFKLLFKSNKTDMGDHTIIWRFTVNLVTFW